MEPAEFDEFYRASFGRLVGQVYAMCGDAPEAQDCVQEAFIRAWDHRRQLERAQSAEAWVRTTAWRLAISRWRRVKRGMRLAELSVAPTVAEPDINHVALVEGLKRIPDEQRRAIVLHHLCDMPVSAVAAETGVSPGTVKARLSRGRAALAQHVSAEQSEGVRHGQV